MLDIRPKSAHFATSGKKNTTTTRRFTQHLPQEWSSDAFLRPPFSWLDDLYALCCIKTWPDFNWLNADASLPVRFVSQQMLDEQTLCYESFIHTYEQVPTRPQNWHDLFNALIWKQFPRSKSALNRLHMTDINAVGSNQRTPRRNRITHFDECGVLMIYSTEEIPNLLKQHEWHAAFVDRRSDWGTRVQALVFGHANYEMLLKPYIGLTGKWLGIQVPKDYFSWDNKQQLAYVDEKLVERLEQQNCLGERGALWPLPLLGVPGWWPDNEHAAFYANQNYFMPKRK
ncbi:DUF3025 domain-containing protein [Bowmanella yangjiangensis]|uniref:DUF3025 domain-containing protein n=1 Tax=Bowmanella yangjiangensis TaxID=2811230 RepID=A0ABS3CVA6_9ALTE|nr:DUF3025 domain-containing protein [Bowmanella yangjiangensis]MBN7820081.1 DUF3025 domain-containing protein [Bowmanella yangjiangensis]